MVIRINAKNAVLKDLKRTYDYIAEDFSSTRQKIWSELVTLDLEKYDSVLEVGCGNSRNLKYLKEKGVRFLVGLDFAKSFFKHRLTGIHYVVGNALYLPFKNESFEVVMAIAVLHHLPSKEMRLKMLKEMMRVSKNLVVLSVWYRYSKLRKTTKKEEDIRWRGKYSRYYYFYDYEEFCEDLTTLGSKKFKVFTHDYNNLWAVIYK